MIRASWRETVGGAEVTFALPLHALRDLAAHEPRLYALAERLTRQDALEDVVAVLSAACGGAEAARRVVEECGLMGAQERAARILALALTDERPERDDAGKLTTATETPPPTRSSRSGGIWSMARRWAGPRRPS